MSNNNPGRDFEFVKKAVASIDTEWQIEAAEKLIELYANRHRDADNISALLQLLHDRKDAFNNSMELIASDVINNS